MSTQTDLDWYLSDVDGVPEVLDADDDEIVEGELTAPVIPIAADEFRCDGCFLIRHRSQLARTAGGAQICRDCD